MKNLRNLSIYLGTQCNFSCEYCDREFIATNFGNQCMQDQDVENIVEFIKYAKEKTPELEMIDFHGGEPFLFIGIMDAVIEKVVEFMPDVTIFIQTNGSLIVDSKDSYEFLKRWKDYLFISISYDFADQKTNREYIHIYSLLGILTRELQIKTRFQPVLKPGTHNFKPSQTGKIIEIHKDYNLYPMNIILLRHIRGGCNGKMFVYESKEEMVNFFANFVHFVETLYHYDLNFFIDGYDIETEDVSKDYFDNHSQLILSPDGLLYPEYDFLDYREMKGCVGRWKDGIWDRRETNGIDLIHTCVNCEMSSKCGLKFIYGMSNTGVENESLCKSFYSLVDMLFGHVRNLRIRKSFFEHVEK